MFTNDLEELKNKHTEINNTLEGINSNIADAEKQRSVLEDRIVEITATKENIEKRMKKQQQKNEDSLRDLWDNIKHIIIHIIGDPQGKRKNPRKYLKR